jgi:hypothetical protein
MPNRKRWYAELAGTFLLWVEEVPDNPPWKAYILRRPRLGAVEFPAGKFIEFQISPTRESFIARDENIAMESAETTIRNDPDYRDYAHRVGEMKWQKSEVSDEEWQERCAKFVQGVRE